MNECHAMNAKQIGNKKKNKQSKKSKNKQTCCFYITALMTFLVYLTSGSSCIDRERSV